MPKKCARQNSPNPIPFCEYLTRLRKKQAEECEDNKRTTKRRRRTNGETSAWRTRYVPNSDCEGLHDGARPRAQSPSQCEQKQKQKQRQLAKSQTQKQRKANESMQKPSNATFKPLRKKRRSIERGTERNRERKGGRETMGERVVRAKAAQLLLEL